MRKQILILGGLGFIGFHLSKKISEDKNNILTIVDDGSRGQLDYEAKKLIQKKNVNFLKINLSKEENFKKLKKNFDHVYLLASIVGVNNTLTNPNRVIEINSLIILNTLRWLISKKIKKFMFTSTSETYAGTIDYFNYKIPTDENVPLTITEVGHPRYTYAITKLLGESAFLNLSKKSKTKILVVRFHNIFGERMGFKHVIPHLIERFYKKEKPFSIYGGKQTRAFCYISDAIDQMLGLMKKKKNNFKIYNIGNDTEVTIEKLVKLVGKKFDYKNSYLNKESFPGSTRRRCPNISRIKKELQYKPKIKLENGLEKTIKWYLKFFENKKTLFEKSFQKPSDFKNVQ